MPDNKASVATNALLNILSSANAELSLGVTIGETVVPLIVGLVKKIQSKMNGTTVEYTITLASTGALLDSIIAAGSTDLAAINAELARVGLPPLPDPAGQ